MLRALHIDKMKEGCGLRTGKLGKTGLGKGVKKGAVISCGGGGVRISYRLIPIRWSFVDIRILSRSMSA